jgi:hypothetical protein
MAQRDAIKATIYEVTSISDVMRSATKATETLGAQQLKAQYGNSRLSPRQRQVQMHVRDAIRIAAEIIAEHFSPGTLNMIVGAQIAPEVLALMRADRLRELRIDVETDSTIQPDAGEEQRNRVEMLTAMTAFAEKAIPAVQSGMIPAEIAKEMVLFGLRAFKASPQIETLIDTATQGAAGGDDQARAMQLQAREQELMQREQMAAQALAEREQQMQAAAQQLQEREQQIAAAEQRLTAGAQQLQAQESATRNEMGRRQQEISAASMQAQEARITAMVESFMARIASGAAANVDEKAACEAAERQAVLASDEARAARSEELMRAMLATHQESMAQIAQLMKIVAAPKRAIRDNAGKLIGVAPAVNDA